MITVNSIVLCSIQDVLVMIANISGGLCFMGVHVQSCACSVVMCQFVQRLEERQDLQISFGGGI